MEKHTFTVDKGNAGLRLDLFLVGHFPSSVSRTFLQKLIGQKNILVNGAPRKSHYRIEAGDFIEAGIPKPYRPAVKAERIPLRVIYEDSRIIIIDKPAGMVVHPAPGHYTGTLVNALLYRCDALSSSADARPGIVHRLDKNTSGLLVVAKDEEAHAFLARQFRKRTTDKRYIAIVEGVVQLDNGMISHPIGRHPRDRKRMSVRFSGAKESVTRYRALQRFKDATLVEVRPETGRTHQIRVHLSYLGHPILGDTAYGSRKKSALITRQALHAAKISFLHPGTRKAVCFESPVPGDISEALSVLRNMR